MIDDGGPAADKRSEKTGNKKKEKLTVVCM